MPIGPGYDDSEYDDYDPAWSEQSTSFRRWLIDKLTNAGSSCALDIASSFAPANRYNGLSAVDMDNLALLTGTSYHDVRAAHRDDLAEWAGEQQLMDHPDLAVLDADRIRHRS
ncbi:hypothetical protein ABZY44_25105 [Streptomyces sp. NPDC006544]|uniref:hypothetical protein n=1 Tax=Streptomyces sp. NPDC006544 TaxID=3154583 RepID=UPI0033A46FF7